MYPTAVGHWRALPFQLSTSRVTLTAAQRRQRRDDPDRWTITDDKVAQAIAQFKQNTPMDLLHRPSPAHRQCRRPSLMRRIGAEARAHIVGLLRDRARRCADGERIQLYSDQPWQSPLRASPGCSIPRAQARANSDRSPATGSWQAAMPPTIVPLQRSAGQKRQRAAQGGPKRSKKRKRKRKRRTSTTAAAMPSFSRS